MPIRPLFVGVPPVSSCNERPGLTPELPQGRHGIHLSWNEAAHILSGAGNLFNGKHRT
jgi:hypothetical protein